MLPYILITILLVVGLFIVVLISDNFKLNERYIKIKEANENISILLKKKLEGCNKIVKIIDEKNEDELCKEFKINNSKDLSNFELNDKVNDLYNRIIEIVDYNKDVILDDDETKKLNKLKDLNLELLGVQKYYNENAKDMNKYVGRIPYNLVAKFKGYKRVKLYENTKKEIFEILKK